MTGGTGSEEDNVRRFDAEMASIYDGPRAIGYPANRFLMMIREHGGLETAHRLLRSSDISYGFAELCARGLQDLAVEAVALRPEFQQLFSIAELDSARARLGR
jgi:hypothetical protein